MKSFLIACAASISLLPSPTLADDTAERWRGGYVALGLGVASVDGDLVESRHGEENGYTAEWDESVLIGGVAGGYNFWTSERWVLGAEATISGLDLSSTVLYAEDGIPDPDYPIELSASLQTSARLRLGVVTGRSLFFLTGGMGYGEFEYLLFESGDTATFQTSSTGWTAGIGAEIAINAHWSGRFDYAHTDFGSETFDSASIFGIGHTETVENEQDVFTVGFGYSF